jgi:hypothetical protein
MATLRTVHIPSFRRPKPLRSLRFLLLDLFLSLTTAFATSPRLADITPTGAQRGTEIEVLFQGERLQDTEEVICHEPGIQVLKINSVTNNLVKAQLNILPDCLLGEHHLRLRTATGLSELRTFFVGPFPAVDEIEPNNDAEHAQKVELNSTVTGVIKNEDVDCFAVELKKGQRLSAEVEGMRLGRGAFDPRLSILGPEGSVLAEIGETWLGMQDPCVSLSAPQDGKYVIRLRETTYAGNDNCHYRLHIGSFPRPTSVFPAGGKAGETVSFTFFSEATGEFVQPIKLPDRPQERFGLFAELEQLAAPTPNWIRVCDFSNVLAAPPNQDRDHATVTEQVPPIGFNGVLGRKAQDDWFRFPATKGVPLDVSVYARRLHSPVDSVVEIIDAKGLSLGANDDAAGADSSLKFTPADTTNYFVHIHDTLGRGGRDFVYRIEVTPVSPSLSLKIPEVTRNDTQSRQYITVPRGNRFATLISARRSNFGGELALACPELPQGVTLVSDRMAANVDSLPLVFEADPDAPIACKLLDLTATWTNESNQVVGSFRQDVELVDGPNNTSFYGTRVNKLCVAVTKEAPFRLRIVEPRVPLVQAGSMALQIVAERLEGFDEPIEVQMVWTPPGVSSQSEATIPKGATNVTYQLNAGGGAETRAWKIAVLGHATVDGGPVYVSSQLANLEVAAPFLSGKIETLWANPGKPGKLTVNLQQAKPFEGKATIRLCGLPEKITTVEKQITKDDQDVTFDLNVAPDCGVGSYKNLFCAVDVKQKDETIPHNIAFGGIVRVAQPKKTETKVASAPAAK